MRKMLFLWSFFLLSFTISADEKITAAIMKENVTVRGGSYSQSNFSDKNDLIVSASSDPGKIQHVYLKADISRIQPDFQKVSLRLYPQSGINGWIDVYSVGDDWDEETLTYDTQPGEEGYVTTFQVTAPYTDVDLTSFVSGKVGVDNTLSFKLTGASFHYFSFFHQQYDKWPRMIVIYEDSSSYAPYVDIYSHEDGQIIHPSWNIHGDIPIWVSVDAIDIDGEIAGVNMSCNGHNLGTKTRRPYTWLIDIVPGNYHFAVRAWDNDRNVSVEEVTITVDNNYRIAPKGEANLRGGAYADSYNYPTKYLLLRNSPNPDYYYEAALSFVLSQFNGNVHSATLRLRPDGGLGLSGLLSYSESDRWYENRWYLNNKPADIKPLSPWIITGDVLEIDVTDIVNRESQRDGLVTFFLKGNNPYESVKFHDLSTAMRPVLFVEKNVKPPVAADDSFIVRRNYSVFLDIQKLLENDYDPEGKPLSVIDYESPQFGSLSGNPESGYIYTPNLNFTGTDTFSYVIFDGHYTDQAVIRITVTP